MRTIKFTNHSLPMGRNMKNALLLSLGLALSVQVNAQQDPQFTQYMFNMLAINPAYAGSAERISLKALSRHQWTGFDGAPTTQTLTAHSPILTESIALGGTVMRDQHGPITQYGLFVDASYRIFFQEAKLAFGLKGGMTMFQGDFGDLNPIDDNDPVFQTNVKSKLDPQFGFGMMYYSDKFFVGLSAPRLLRTEFFDTDSLQFISEPGQREHFFFSAGYVFALNPYMKLKPTVLMKAVDGAPPSFDVSANVLFYEKFWIGAMYRHEDAIGAMVQFNFTEQLSAGYAFDLTLSPLKDYSNGTHEIMVGFDFGGLLKGVRSPRYF